MKKDNPNHKMGKLTGYEIVDGGYRIAPLYQERFSSLFFKRKGIEEMLAIVTRHASSDLVEISIELHRIWEDLSKDIGIDHSESWTYLNGVIKKLKVPSEKVS